jgi:predicted acetyltransferase
VTVRVRGIEASELDAVIDVDTTAFGEQPTEEERQDERELAEVDRMLAAEEDGRIVGAAGAVTFDMTVPGGASVPAAGVSWVGVLPTHRRRGVLTSLMRRQLDDVAERGEPVAVLTASEAAIYGRFGYGLATRLARVQIDTARGLPLASPPTAAGRVRFVDVDEAVPHAKRLVEEVRAQRNGEVTRPDYWWPVFVRDREKDRDGASARFWVVHESPGGDVDGLAHYRVKRVWGEQDAIARSEVQLEEVYAPDAEVEAALLVFLCELDLTASLTTWSRPVDDPFRLRLLDDRRYRVDLLHDHLYLRVLDVEAALSARSYEADDTVVLGVDDAFRPSTSGRYRLAGGKAEQVGDLHDGDADAFLAVDALGCLYLGDATARQLADAGRLRPSSDESLARVDRVFRTDRAPFCTMHF